MRYQNYISLLLLYIFGFIGWQLFKRLKIPAAAILGSMIFVGLAQVWGKYTLCVPWWINPILQSIIGISIGTKINKKIYGHLRKVALPVVISSLWWLVVSLLTGYVFYRLNFFEAKTAFLGTASGGITEMALIAISVNANVEQIIFLQFFRFLFIMICVPFLCRFLQSKEVHNNRLNIMPDRKYSNSSFHFSKAEIYTLCLGLTGGTILYLTGIPTGGLIGALLVVGTINLLVWEEASIPTNLTLFAQIGLGGIVGLNMNVETIQMLREALWPALFLALLLLISGVILALIMVKVTHLDIQTCLLATSAGGLTQMAIVSEEFGADSITVTLMQLTRLLTIITILPTLHTVFW